MKKREIMDDLFREKLAGHTLPVTDKMWMGIEKHIQKKKFRTLLSWYIVGGLLLLSLLGFGAYYFISKQASDAPANDSTAAIFHNKIDNSQNNVNPESNVTSNLMNIEDGERKSVESSINKNTNVQKTDNETSIVNSAASVPGTEALNTAGKTERVRNDVPGKAFPLAERSQAGGEAALAENYHNNNTASGQESVNSTSNKNAQKDAQMFPSKSDKLNSSSGTNSTRTAIPSLAELYSEDLTNRVIAYEAFSKPRSRTLRDRNCEDETFKAPRTFIEISYGMHRGDMIFKSTGSAFDEYNRMRNQGEVFKSGSQLQALVGIQMGERLFFKTGISYTKVESDYYFVDQLNKRIIKDSIWNGQEWEVTERETDIFISGVNSYSFIDIPLLLSYGLQFNKLGVSLTAGPMINLAFMRSGKLPNDMGQGIPLDDGMWNDKEIYRKTAGISLFTGLQLSYQTYRNVELYIEPRMIAGLNPLTLENDGLEPDASKINYPVSHKMFQYGVGVGIRFSLN